VSLGHEACAYTSGEGFNRFATFFQSALSAWGQANMAIYGQILLGEFPRVQHN
jgi:hypothetical protein